MQNLDQIRAAAALAAVNRADNHITKQTVSKLPAMIMANGLLAAAAFADERTKDGAAKRTEMQDAMNQTAKHLNHPHLAISSLSGCETARDLISKLTSANSGDLTRATSESLAFLAYLKRFATKD